MNKKAHAGVLLVLGSIGLVHCSGDDEETEGEKVCKQVDAKLAECNLTLQGGAACNPGSPCAGRCFASAPCDEVTSGATDTPYYQCILACSGVGEDDFVCASGNAFISANGVCDGIPQCPDGSDEADCDTPDAG